jgi:protein-disulfide isomerase
VNVLETVMKKIKLSLWRWMIVACLVLGVTSGSMCYKSTAVKASENMSRYVSNFDIVFGDQNAPNTVHEYSSLTCYHCAIFHNKILPYLKKKYLDTGIVKIIFHHFPIDQIALKASMLIADCQDIRQQMLLLTLYEKQSQWLVRGYATKLKQICGVSDQEYSKIVNNTELLEAVLMERLRAEKEFKINATPTFIFNGKNYDYALSIEEFDNLLEPYLS